MAKILLSLSSLFDKFTDDDKRLDAVRSALFYASVTVAVVIGGITFGIKSYFDYQLKQQKMFRAASFVDGNGNRYFIAPDGKLVVAVEKAHDLAITSKVETSVKVGE